MKKSLAILALACSAAAAVSCQGRKGADSTTADASPASAPATAEERTRWTQRAEGVTIVRDDWGIAHIRGKTDADAVFGLIYAQAEDDFNRIEVNYLNAMGRLAEAQGESEIFRDLRMKLFIDPDSMKAKYASSPEFLRTLMDAWADGLNFYLSKHPEVKPKVLTRFEPWMALTFSEGSIGGDIESVSLRDLEAMYGTADSKVTARVLDAPKAPSGSNGFAIAPSKSASGKSLLLINPHTSFFFRSEVQVTSEEGLNAYGAVTWGQFFVYQGFNARAGWMHTSSGADAIDEYAEDVVRKDGVMHYRYGGEERRLTEHRITIPYKTAAGTATRDFTVYRSHHGPIVREANGKWVAVKLMQEPVKALTQSYTRTKATGYESFKETMELHTNSSNNTVFADADGNIAYFHANFVPKRDPKLDWSRPVDGSDSTTEWRGLHSVDETVGLLNPKSGWIQNTNNWPYSAAGAGSPRERDFPPYMDRAGENPRGLHALRVLQARDKFTLETLIEAAYDPYLTGFEKLVPAVLKDYEALPTSSPLKAKLADQIAALRAWDLRWSVSSVPTSLAVFWGEELWQRVRGDAESERIAVFNYMEQKATPAQRLDALAAASDTLASHFGTWKTAWGDINRFQRLTGDIVQPFNDARESIPVAFTSSRWGSLASFQARPYPGTKKWYGTSGNSFVAVVEFGDSVRAKAVTAGGESGDPKSPHFNDQAQRYATGALRDVYFYPSQLAGHTRREYHPGQ